MTTQRLIGYRVTITMAGGSCGRHLGLYSDSATAAARATDLFPQAERIRVERLSTFCAGRLPYQPTARDVVFTQGARP